jgi:AcrR family transcriptional regulator
MEFFWLKGYDGASTADLATALGVNRATMYAEFGSKHALYQLSLRYYLEHTVPGFIGELLPEDAGLDAMLTALGLHDLRGGLGDGVLRRRDARRGGPVRGAVAGCVSKRVGERGGRARPGL